MGAVCTVAGFPLTVDVFVIAAEWLRYSDLLL